MQRFYALTGLIVDAYNHEDFATTKKLALEYLKLANRYPDHWNYGNAIHVANIYLGLVALKSKEIKPAKEYLIAAGQIPGSPQLNHFGPNMLLAKELLEIGERKVVLKYLASCKKFWKWIFRIRPMIKWSGKIKKGEIPDFGVNLVYHSNFRMP